MSNQKKSVYLAGPITGLTYGEARNGWRKEFADLLKTQSPHIECYSPMRAKEFLKGQSDLQCKGAELEAVNNALCKPRGILARDSNDVLSRDAIVACFLGADRVSIGTVWELGLAYGARKPGIIIMEPEGNLHDHIFVTHSFGYVVPSLEEAALILGALLTPGI